MDKSVYQRPSKPRRMYGAPNIEAPVLAPLKAPEVVAVDRATECHVTPPDVAARMVRYLGATGDYLTLEPSAGTGNLVQALYDSGHSRFELVAVERHSGLCSQIRQRFSDDQAIDPINECFLAYAERAQGSIEYPRIVMNPPFKQVRRHMKAALSLLGFGGHHEATMVALVPITYHHDDAETLEELPRDTFSTATVSTKIIRIAYRTDGSRPAGGGIHNDQ